LSNGRQELRAEERVRSGLPLSPNEERYVLSEAMSSENYGNPWTFRIKGPLDEGRLRDAIQAMCDRHESRRTGFEADSDGRFTRFVEARGRPEVRSVSMIGASPADVRAAVRAWFFERGDLNPRSFTRFLLIRVAEDEHILGNYFHHSVNDGESHREAMAEIFDRYAGRDPTGPAVQYSDLWQWDWRSSPAYLEAEAFWKQFLAGVDETGELASDGGDAPGAEWAGPVNLRLPPDLAAAAKQAAATAGVSEFVFYYAVALVLLTRLAGRPRVCSTFQSSGRRLVPGSEGVHGVFSNGLVLATEVDEGSSIAELAGKLRGEVRAALAHEAYPYHHIIQATGLRPRFGINWFPEMVFPECPGLEISPPAMDYGNWEYDLNVRFVRHIESGGVDLVLYFGERVMSRARALAAAEQFAALLAAFGGDVTAPIRQTASRLLPLSKGLPDPDDALPEGGGELIHAAFLRRAQARPDATAIVHGDDRWSYAEVERRSRVVAARLRAAGVGPGDRVAILADRGPELIWSMLGTARLGAVFVVMDSAYPQARLRALANIAAPGLILVAGGAATGDLARRLSEAVSVPLAGPAVASDNAEASGLDAASPDAAAYILFTSGSTGAAKGVACSHRPLSRFTAWQAETFGLTPDDRFGMLSGLSHDPLLRDIFTPLSLGAAIVIPDTATILAPGALTRWFRDAGITVAHMTPALGSVLMAGAARVRRLPALRHLFWGGDLLAPDLVREVEGLAPDAAQTNFYGSTETPQAVGMFACAGSCPRRAVPVGKGANGAQLLVVDAARDPLGVGEVGEIAVRSNFLSLGYVAGGEIVTADDRGVDASGRVAIYYTGDRGLYLPDGDVLFLGRADDQVKVRGHRVELAEVTAALLAQPALDQAITLAVGEGAGLKIHAFVSAGRRRTAPSEGELSAALATRLPAYMLPHAIHVLKRLPLLPNGKVDRQALKTLALTEPETQAGPDLAGASEVERALIARWSAVLGQTRISRTSAFSGLGGDSLSYVQAYLATEEVIGVVPSGWQAMSIAELAAQVRGARGFWSTVDTPMLVRAIAIFLVVVGHMRLGAYGGGATAGLMVVSGFLFGNLQLAETFARRSAQPILDGLRRLLVPTMLFSVALFTAKALMGKHPDLSVLFLYGNFQDYSKLTGPRWGGHEFYLWFIYCTIQMMGLLYLAALALGRAGGFALSRMSFVLLVFVAGCIGRFAAPAFFIPNFFTEGAPRMTALNFLPTTHLPTLMMGAFIAVAETPWERRAVLGLLFAYAALTAQIYNLQQGLVILAAVLLIFAVRRLPLPRPLSALVLTLSAASLFIYLTHFQFRSVLRAIGAPDWPMLHVVVALAGGVAVWAGWVWVSAFAARRLRRTRATQPLPAI